MMRVDGAVTLAGRLLETARVGNIDVTAAVTDYSRSLQRMSDERNRVSLHAHQLRQGFLSQRQRFVAA